MSDNLKIISGFKFIKAGTFRFSDKPYQFKSWTSKLVIQFEDERYEKADETAYLLMHDEKILYVGEFTYNLRNRWLSKNHVNHHTYEKIENILTEGKVISLWLAISPFLQIPECGELNVSKALEQQIMKDHLPKWNSRNILSGAKEWREKNCIRLDSFIKKH